MILTIIDPDNLAAIIPFGVLSLFTAGIMEWIHPHTLQWRKSYGDIRTDIFHQLFSLPLSQLLRAGLIYAFFTIIQEPAASFALITWPTQWPLWCQAALGLVVSELGTYSRHRLFHEWHIGWRFHSVHHSAKRLYFLNAPRFHFVDLCLSGLASAIPLALFGAPPVVVVLVALFTALHGNWQHANVRYKLGWLNWVFAGAELHRWHHSSIIRHSNSNYGNNLILFDIVFGTRCLPKSAQDIDELGLGENDAQFPQSWWRQLLLPFRWKSMLKVITSNEE
ncbi:sterol desaturase family protein [Halieaceae bacterium IMCC14734]|uniref:Sterol desaturase family protein n=1 Tax=Candidatus Litorirhabdus singularis TaxID=2518993 RepID=A0ABT3TJU9_9GAMM|nr:sterol desaturase family protein [Candidatus Litorirhabdus singularis]MCX2982051.1 sterol desaturase family protein [Candidatus Litorirhabdus singularis]